MTQKEILETHLSQLDVLRRYFDAEPRRRIVLAEFGPYLYILVGTRFDSEGEQVEYAQAVLTPDAGPASGFIPFARYEVFEGGAAETVEAAMELAEQAARESMKRLATYF